MGKTKDGLTPKQKRFAKEYVKTGNGAEAARRAGYSKRRANVTAAENVAKRSVQEFIEELGAEAEVIKGLTIEHIMAMLAKEARTAETDGARVRAQELLGKWKGAFVEKYEDLTNRDNTAESIIAAIEKISPEAARVLAVEMGIEPAEPGQAHAGKRLTH